jgi:hypothetical protein
MLKITDNIITDELIKKLALSCGEFVPNQEPNLSNKNYYVRKYVDNKDGLVNEYLQKINNFNNNNFIVDYNIISSWINRVTNETNKSDLPHFDSANLTFVTYLNDDYLGGDFEYFINNESFIIKPKKGMTLVMTGELFHRVLPIVSGVRYSLVTFCRFSNKNKSLLI